MANRGGRGGQKRTTPTEDGPSAFDWFASSNQWQGAVGSWDFDYQALGDAVLGLLGDSIGIMFVRGSGGSAVGVVIMQGEKPWPRSYFHEAEDLEEGLRRIAARTTRGKPNPLKIAE